MLVTVVIFVLVHPSKVVTVRVTICEVAFPWKVCVIFGLVGKVIGGIICPSPKSHCHVLIEEEYPVGTYDWL